jgi:hypothetical protein
MGYTKETWQWSKTTLFKVLRQVMLCCKFFVLNLCDDMDDLTNNFSLILVDTCSDK